MNADLNRGFARHEFGHDGSRGRGVSRVQRRRRGGSRQARLGCAESLEPRRLLAADPHPFVQSIDLIGSPQTFSTTREYAVIFSEAVSGVDPADFQLSLTGVAVTSPVVVSGTGSAYTVKISGISGVGELGLNLVDNDSIRDLSGNPLTFLNAGVVFEPQVSLAAGDYPYSSAVCDLNGDTKADLVVGTLQSRTLSIFLGNGDGTFQPLLTFGGGFASWSIAVGDMNRDGRQDLAAVDAYTDTVHVLLGNGDGTLTPGPVYASVGAPLWLELGDLNADGLLDIATANVGSNTLAILLGNGDGSFQAPFAVATASQPSSLALGDVNADGRTDIVVANAYGANSAGVLLGNGDGTFLPPVQFPTGFRPLAVELADVDDDAILDLLVANTGDSTVGVLLGAGDGTFQPHQAYDVGITPTSVAACDVNGDGFPDLVVANDGGDSTVSILLGRGMGTFMVQTIVPVDPVPISVVTADFNRDGRVDLATANGNGNSASVLLNGIDGSFTGQTTTVRVGNVYTVTTTANAGAGSLRQAILNANAHAGPDTITFAIPGAGRAITLSSALPAISGEVAIDGFSQAGVSLVGSRVSAAITGLNFAAAATSSYLGGLTVSGFKGIGIAATNAKVTVQGNTLTGNKTGISLVGSPASLVGGADAALGNMLTGNTVGIALSGACTGTVVDRNVMKNNAVGVSLTNATGARIGVVGNTIAASTSHGVRASGNLTGTIVQANAISGTTLYGIFLTSAVNLMVTGNTITDGKPQGSGLYATGTLTGALVQGNMISLNRGNGVLLDNARGITIGLTAAGTGSANTIANNGGFGLRAFGISTGSAVRKNVISGNTVNVQITAAKDLIYVP